jgi:hypothetical protein
LLNELTMELIMYQKAMMLKKLAVNKETS